MNKTITLMIIMVSVFCFSAGYIVGSKQERLVEEIRTEIPEDIPSILVRLQEIERNQQYCVYEAWHCDYVQIEEVVDLILQHLNLELEYHYSIPAGATLKSTKEIEK